MLDKTLILVPTQLEFQVLRQGLPPGLHLELCGFGPVAAGIEAMRYLCRPEYFATQRVILVGLGGTYDAAQLPVGSATCFRRVSMWGIGAGMETDLQTPSQLLLPQVVFADGTACFDTIELDSLPGLDSPHIADGLLTVPSASGDLNQANLRRDRNPHSTCEDMEGYAVALAARQRSLPVSIIRGISNIAGDRDKENWKIKQALQAAAELLVSG